MKGDMKDLVCFHEALANEHRLRILHLIQNKEISVNFLSQILETKQPKISRHLAYLKKANLVRSRREEQWIYYRLKKPHKDLEPILSKTLFVLKKKPIIQQDFRKLKQFEKSNLKAIL